MNKLLIDSNENLQQFQGQPGGGPPRGPRPDWNRPPMHQGFSQNNSGPGHLNPPMQGHLRGPPPQSQMGKLSQNRY